ncbi:MAG: DNA mismatch repair protein MutT [Nocardioides sp.]|nr:DNA mismatch repair protein MutT [Nocardioides sp.]
MPDGTDRRAVVGAAIVRDGRVLACRRTEPPALAGGWELPGGKVEPGETPEHALVREGHEELGLALRVERWLDGVSDIGADLRLRIAVTRLDGPFAPYPVDHDRLRWLGADELRDVAWLESDVPFLDQLHDVLVDDVRGTMAP